MTASCGVCRAEFEEHSTYDGRPLPNISRRYCGLTCARLADRAHTKERRDREALPAGTCAECGATFEAAHLWNKRFCGKRCRNRSKKRRENAELRKSRRLTYAWGVVTCGACGSTFDNRDPYAGMKAPSVPRRYCSLRCKKQGSNRGADRVRRLAKYGLSVAEHDRLLASQGGVCAICKQPERSLRRDTGEPNPLRVDHDHQTGEVRGLLCNGCNSMLGMADDDPAVLQRGVDYLLTARGFSGKQVHTTAVDDDTAPMEETR